MPAPPYVALADRIAEQAHTGQVDKAGVPYIEHPRAVAQIVVDFVAPEDRWIAMTAALLHDVLEDSDAYTAETLRAAGIPAEAVEVVRTVTHEPGEERSVYLERIITGHPLALYVKVADMSHNLDPYRLAALDEPTRERLLAKYGGEWALLTETLRKRQVASWAMEDV